MSNHGQQTGFIAASALLFLTILSILSLSLLTRLQVEHKMTWNYLAPLQEFYAAEAGLLQAEEHVCSPHARHTEKFNYAGYQVSYQITDLQITPCILSTKELGHYYRITAEASLPNQTEKILQSTYVCSLNRSCGSKKNYALLGRNSWREF